jgi:hypothetical protein
MEENQNLTKEPRKKLEIRKQRSNLNKKQIERLL